MSSACDLCLEKTETFVRTDQGLICLECEDHLEREAQLFEEEYRQSIDYLISPEEVR